MNKTTIIMCTHGGYCTHKHLKDQLYPPAVGDLTFGQFSWFFLWFQVCFPVFMVFKVTGWFFLVPGYFLSFFFLIPDRFFIVPGRFLWFQDDFYSLFRFQVGFSLF